MIYRVEANQGKRFAFVIDANRFKFQVETTAHETPALVQNERFSPLYEMAKNMDYEDNPVIVFADLKLD